MSWLQWFTALSLSGSLLILPSAQAEEESMAEYIAKEKAIAAKATLKSTLDHGIITHAGEKALADQEIMIRDIFNKGTWSKYEQKPKAYTEYYQRAMAYAEDPKLHADHKGKWRYDYTTGELIVDANGKPKYFNSNIDEIASTIKDPAEQQKFRTWAEAVDPAFEQKAKIEVARKAKEDFKKQLAANASVTHRPMALDEYNNLAKTLDKMSLPPDEYEKVKAELEKLRAMTPGIKDKPYPYGQKAVSTSCLMKGLK